MRAPPPGPVHLTARCLAVPAVAETFPPFVSLAPCGFYRGFSSRAGTAPTPGERNPGPPRSDAGHLPVGLESEQRQFDSEGKKMGQD